MELDSAHTTVLTLCVTLYTGEPSGHRVEPSFGPRCGGTAPRPNTPSLTQVPKIRQRLVNREWPRKPTSGSLNTTKQRLQSEQDLALFVGCVRLGSLRMSGT